MRHIQDIELQRNLSKTNNIDYIYENMFLSRKNHYDHIRFGFDYVMDSTSSKSDLGKKIRETFSAFDFPFIFYHFEPISTDKLRSLVCYVNCNSTTKEIVWLWEELDRKDQNFLSKFLLFCTGSGNLTNLINENAFVIEKTRSENELFRSSACIKRLYISKFDTKEKLVKSLDTSILNSEGFHFI